MGALRDLTASITDFAINEKLENGNFYKILDHKNKKAINVSRSVLKIRLERRQKASKVINHDG